MVKRSRQSGGRSMLADKRKKGSSFDFRELVVHLLGPFVDPRRIFCVRRRRMLTNLFLKTNSIFVYVLELSHVDQFLCVPGRPNRRPILPCSVSTSAPQELHKAQQVLQYFHSRIPTSHSIIPTSQGQKTKQNESIQCTETKFQCTYLTFNPTPPRPSATPPDTAQSRVHRAIHWGMGCCGVLVEVLVEVLLAILITPYKLFFKKHCLH